MSIIALLLLAAAPTWPPPDMPTEAQFKQIQKMAAGARLQPSPTAPPSTVDDTGPKPFNDGEMKAGIERFQNGWFLGGEFFGKQMVEVDLFLLPNADWAKVTYQWISPRSAELQTLDFRSGRVEIPLDGKELLTEAKAKVTIEAPLGFDEVTIACGNIGKPEKRGTMTFTIDSCDRDVFNMRVDGFEENDRVVPLDAQKRALVTGESSHGVLFSGKDIDQVTYAEFKKGPSATTRISARAKGTVAFVRWLRAKPGKKIEIDVTAVPEPKAEGFGPSSRPRYAPPAMSTPALTTIDDKNIVLQLQSGRSCAMFGHNAPQIDLVLPQAGNSLLAKIELAPPKVKGGKGGFELETNGLDERRLRYHWTLRPKVQSKKDTPFAFATIDAEATVQYPLKGETRRIDRPSDAVAIAGNRVSVKLQEGEELADTSELPGIKAYDRTGRELRRFNTSEWNDEGQTFHFMGQVASVQLNVVSQWVDRKITAKLKPAPLRPREKAGSCE